MTHKGEGYELFCSAGPTSNIMRLTGHGDRCSEIRYYADCILCNWTSGDYYTRGHALVAAEEHTNGHNAKETTMDDTTAKNHAIPAEGSAIGESAVSRIIRISALIQHYNECGPTELETRDWFGDIRRIIES